MVNDLFDYLRGIALGIRFRANFSIEDQMGKIVDTILYPDDSFFTPDVFPKLITPGIGNRILHNENTQDRIRIDNSNIVLEINFGENQKFQVVDLDNILEKFEDQIIKRVMKDFSIKEILRIGYIRRYIFTDKKLADNFVSKTIGYTLEGINDINLNFSRKIPILASIANKDVNDYDNAIFNVIKRADKEEIFISLDYQSYFDPFLPQYSNIKFQPFIKTATDFNNKKFLEWLNSNYVEEKNEKKDFS